MNEVTRLVDWASAHPQQAAAFARLEKCDPHGRQLRRTQRMTLKVVMATKDFLVNDLQRVLDCNMVPRTMITVCSIGLV